MSLAATSSSWTVYHGNSLGTGLDASGATFSPATGFWASPTLDGDLYGEPLVSGGRVFVATESDTVYALAANSGSILWSTHVGTPVPSSSLPCGDIGTTPGSPGTVGITGTPVVDEARGEIFAVADEVANGAVSHHLVGLDIFTGTLVLDQKVDPPGSTPTAQLQRTGLNLSNGNVVFGFGGNDGDCGSYHGWIVAVPEGGGGQLNYEVDSGANEREGAIWMGGAAPEVDGSGNIWAAAGNGSVNSSSGPYDYSDSVFELSPQLALKQYFAPSNWYSQNGADADLGSTAPAILSDGTVLQVGKSHTGYLLSQANLGGIGGQQATASVCSSSTADGGDAVSGNDVFVPCMGGLEDVNTSASPPSLSVSWTDTSTGGPPIVAGGCVWSINGGRLYGIKTASTTGSGIPCDAQQTSLSIGSNVNHFPTPSVGDGLLLATSTNQVHAFSGQAPLPGPPSATPPPAPYVAAFQSAQGQLWTVGGAGWTDWNLGVAYGTSPSTAKLASGGFEVAFQGSDGRLWTVGSAGWTAWDLGVAAGTSPSIAGLPGGGFEVAFQASGGGLWTVGSAGWMAWDLGVAAGTSPSIAGLPGGGFEVAFQASGGGLWTVGSAGWTAWDLGVAPRTSPSVTGLGNGGFEVGFQAAGGQLWSVGSAGWSNWNLGMAPGTNPAIVGLSGSGFEVAFQSSAGVLWTVGSAGWGDWGLGLAPGSSPAITVGAAGGPLEAFHAADGTLWTVSSAGGGSWSLGVAPGTSPAAT